MRPNRFKNAAEPKDVPSAVVDESGNVEVVDECKSHAIDKAISIAWN